MFQKQKIHIMSKNGAFQAFFVYILRKKQKKLNILLIFC